MYRCIFIRVKMGCVISRGCVAFAGTVRGERVKDRSLFIYLLVYLWFLSLDLDGWFFFKKKEIIISTVRFDSRGGGRKMTGRDTGGGRRGWEK